MELRPATNPDGSGDGESPGDLFDDEEGCYECGDEGWVLNDCFEDTCCCADPESQHGYRRCSLCGARNAERS